MMENDWLARRFEENRSHLRAVAYRMLGSAAEADDAVQEAWLRLSRAETSGVENLGGWLTTVVARVCLDALRSRRSRREEPLDARPDGSFADGDAARDPEHEVQLADSVGLALLVVLETLTPAERVAFVLHDLFDLPFDQIAPVVGRTPAAARQLASRVRGAELPAETDRARQREVVNAFVAASRGGDLDALLALLDPEVEFRADATAVRMGGPASASGARAVAETFRGRARNAQPALVDGNVGLLVVVGGQLKVVLAVTVRAGRVAALESIADPERLSRLNIAPLEG
jgi:RNA polymerase sigma-70 factor (ECF subfamily)